MSLILLLTLGSSIETARDRGLIVRRRLRTYQHKNIPAVPRQRNKRTRVACPSARPEPPSEGVLTDSRWKAHVRATLRAISRRRSEARCFVVCGYVRWRGTPVRATPPQRDRLRPRAARRGARGRRPGTPPTPEPAQRHRGNKFQGRVLKNLPEKNPGSAYPGRLGKSIFECIGPIP